MNLFLTLAFLFFIGSVTGWVTELFFRRFVSQKKWLNPGFCTGPYLPIYGFGLCIMFLIATLEKFSIIENPFLNKLMLFAVISLCMTAIEYIAGILIIKTTHVRLWDYTNEWGNIQGIICPKFSLIWAILGAIYYFLIHPHILDALEWLSRNLAFSFFIGLFFGIFILDVIKSAQIISKLKKFADENEIIIKYEAIKTDIQNFHKQTKQKYHFFRPFKTEIPLHEFLKSLKLPFEKHNKKKK